MPVPLHWALLFTLINTVFLIILENIFLRLLLFAYCAIHLRFLGRLPLIDTDPVPIASALLFALYGLPNALQFMIWTLPIVDILVGRFNQWTLLNFSCLAASLLVATLFSTLFGELILMAFVLFLFNIFRLLLSLTVMNMGVLSLTTACSHMLFSLLVLQMISYLVF